jgi:MoaA/NifB/PqqE/SkfB family radical SAM enzyme
MRGTHGWGEIDKERKQEIIAAISSGTATKGPVHAEIDLTDRCNVACYFCNQQDVRTKEQLSIEHVRALIDELAGTGLKSVRLSGGGDPLFHKQILEVLDHLNLRGVVIDNLTTNGVLLGPEVAHRLITGKAREVVFSLNAANDDDYRRMMQVKSGIFDKVAANARGLVEKRGEGIYPSVVVQFLIDRENVHLMPEMYELGRSLGADRVAIAMVLDIPLDRIDANILLDPSEGERLRPPLQAILERDRDAGLLQIHFPVQSWNVMMAEIKMELGYGAEPSLFPTAPSFREENGHCFFGWYTATIRGNGDLYPCCLLMSPDYTPLGNARDGKFSDHWNGPAFTQLREEMRDVLIAGKDASFDPSKQKIIRRQCVEHGLCWLKNIYFRGDEEFYTNLSEALESVRRRERFRLAMGRAVRWTARFPGRAKRRLVREIKSGARRFVSRTPPSP